jgi:hypothetical protein
VQLAASRTRNAQWRRRIGESQRRTRARRTRTELFWLIAQGADPSGLDRSVLWPSEACSLLGFTGSIYRRHGRLRALERLGLVHPQRTPGGHRRYVASELLALVEVAKREATNGGSDHAGR